jgi:uncharacterized protein
MARPVPKRRPAATPLAPAQRLRSLDALRGFAVLGILAVNVQSFSMPEAAYLNPTAYGDLAGLDRWCWLATHVLADRKHLPIFAALFAAGWLQMEGRLQAIGGRLGALHYRRMFWLAMIGLVHAALLWPGDILVSFAIAGALVFPLRRLQPRWLLAAGLAALAAASVLTVGIGRSVPHWSTEAYQEQLLEWRPDAERIERELAFYRGDWLPQVRHRVGAVDATSLIFLFWSAWQTGAILLIGMALYRWGFLTGERSSGCYLGALGLGLGLGLPLVALGAAFNFRAGWRFESSMFYGSQYNYWGSLLVALGYCAAVFLLDRRPAFATLSSRLAEVGRMALSNYLLQSLICTAIFYGWGFGLFGRLDRVGQLGVVALVWIVNLAASHLWLRRFRFGPVEWLWRSLSYRRRLPLA